MTNYATKMMDWGDPNIGYQQQRGQHGEGVTVTHNLVRFIPLPDGALEINFGNTVHFCGGSVVQRSDGELVLSEAQRRELGERLLGAKPALSPDRTPYPRNWTPANSLPEPSPALEALSRQLAEHEDLITMLREMPDPDENARTAAACMRTVYRYIKENEL